MSQHPFTISSLTWNLVLGLSKRFTEIPFRSEIAYIITQHESHCFGIKWSLDIPSGNLAVRYGIDGSVSSLIYHDLPIKSGDFHMLRVPSSLPAAASVSIFQETRQDRTRRSGLGGGAVGGETSVSGDAGGAGYLGIYPWLQCEAPKIAKLVQKTPITMVYGMQITVVPGANLNQLISWGPHIVGLGGTIPKFPKPDISGWWIM